MILPGPDTNTIQLDIETLQENFEKLGTIFNSLREILFTVNLDTGIIENVNNSISTLGFTKQEWEGVSFKDWALFKKKKYFSLLKHARHSSFEASSQQIEILKKDHSASIPFEFSTVLFTFKGKNHLLCVLRDISEREKLLRELEQSLKNERQLNELRASFISTASHQFRTPLTIIQSGVEIMDMYLEDIPEEKRIPFQKQFKRIEGEVQNLQDLMNDILLLGRSNAKRTPFHPELSDIVGLCHDIIKNKFNSRFPENRKINVLVTGENQPVLLDPKLFSHAVENILNNAYKYNKKGMIEMGIDFASDQVLITIKDQGIGIPKKDLVHLFQPFFRAGNTSEIEGTGLGLSIVKEYIDEHNGQISVSSILNKGTTVTISLPLSTKMKPYAR